MFDYNNFTAMLTTLWDYFPFKIPFLCFSCKHTASNTSK